MSIPENTKVLSSPYWMPKMHNLPIGTRYITDSRQCVIKALSKNIATTFKLLYKSVEKYHNKSKFYSGVNSFSVIQNNKSVTDTLNKLSNPEVAKSFFIYDFSTLYANIPHDKLMKALNSVIHFGFKDKT